MIRRDLQCDDAVYDQLREKSGLAISALFVCCKDEIGGYCLDDLISDERCEAIVLVPSGALVGLMQHGEVWERLTNGEILVMAFEERGEAEWLVRWCEAHNEKLQSPAGRYVHPNPMSMQ